MTTKAGTKTRFIFTHKHFTMIYIYKKDAGKITAALQRAKCSEVEVPAKCNKITLHVLYIANN